MKPEEKQQKMMELQIMNQQGEQLKGQLDQMEEQMNNLQRLEESLSSLEKEKIGNSMFTPISSGVFMRTSLEDNKKVLISVGAGVVVEKSLVDAKEMMKEQEKKMELVLLQIRNEMNRFIESAANIEKELSETQ
jgi:prefoldin alpha subunit